MPTNSGISYDYKFLSKYLFFKILISWFRILDMHMIPSGLKTLLYFEHQLPGVKRITHEEIVSEGNE